MSKVINKAFDEGYRSEFTDPKHFHPAHMDKFFYLELCLIQKWLREEKKILVEISALDSWDNFYYRIFAEDCTSPFFEIVHNVEEFRTYSQALEKGILKALEIID